jgi:FMN-dependent NADH-azoreductase
MARLLYIEASPRKDRSTSIKVARTFLEEYKKSKQEDTVDVLDLWKTELPPFDGEAINAKYAILHGEKHTEAQLKAWKPVEDVIDNFKSADKYVFSLPMWNFGVPYRLKHYIDVLTQPTYAFSYTPDEGYKGLITGKPAVLIYARGGAYVPGTETEGIDMQKKYMELILGFIGFTDIRSIVVEPTLMVTHDEKDRLTNQAQEEARKMSAGF